MKFLQKLFKKLGTLKNNSLIAEALDLDGEEVARFAYEKKNHFSVEKKVPKAKLFRPNINPETKDWEASVCRLICSDARIWEIGDTVQNRPALARADLSVSNIRNVGLDVEACPDGPDYLEHAAIVKWPNGRDADETKQKHMELASSLVFFATLRMHP